MGPLWICGIEQEKCSASAADIDGCYTNNLQCLDPGCDCERGTCTTADDYAPFGATASCCEAFEPVVWSEPVPQVVGEDCSEMTGAEKLPQYLPLEDYIKLVAGGDLDQLSTLEMAYTHIYYAAAYYATTDGGWYMARKRNPYASGAEFLHRAYRWCHEAPVDYGGFCASAYGAAEAADTTGAARATPANKWFEDEGAGRGSGGYCVCPDGATFAVGDRNDECGSLSCVNGIPSGVAGAECKPRDAAYEGAGMTVHCAPPESIVSVPGGATAGYRDTSSPTDPALSDVVGDGVDANGNLVYHPTAHKLQKLLSRGEADGAPPVVQCVTAALPADGIGADVSQRLSRLAIAGPNTVAAYPSSADQRTDAGDGRVVYEYPRCKPGCLTDAGEQIVGAYYLLQIDDGKLTDTTQCYKAITACSGCLENLQGGRPQSALADGHLQFASCNAPENNVGDVGGTCTCPSGLTYPVGGWSGTSSSCARLACVGGTPGEECFESRGPWSGKRVECGGNELYPPRDDYGHRSANHLGATAGEHGGYCACANGQVYPVGDEFNNLKSLSCYGGGTSVGKYAHAGPWSGNSVRCAPEVQDEYEYGLVPRFVLFTLPTLGLEAHPINMTALLDAFDGARLERALACPTTGCVWLSFVEHFVEFVTEMAYTSFFKYDVTSLNLAALAFRSYRAFDGNDYFFSETARFREQAEIWSPALSDLAGCPKRPTNEPSAPPAPPSMPAPPKFDEVVAPPKPPTISPPPPPPPTGYIRVCSGWATSIENSGADYLMRFRFKGASGKEEVWTSPPSFVARWGDLPVGQACHTFEQLTNPAPASDGYTGGYIFADLIRDDGVVEGGGVQTLIPYDFSDAAGTRRASWMWGAYMPYGGGGQLRDRPDGATLYFTFWFTQSPCEACAGVCPWQEIDDMGFRAQLDSFVKEPIYYGVCHECGPRCYNTPACNTEDYCATNSFRCQYTDYYEGYGAGCKRPYKNPPCNECRDGGDNDVTRSELYQGNPTPLCDVGYDCSDCGESSAPSRLTCYDLEQECAEEGGMCACNGDVYYVALNEPLYWLKGNRPDLVHGPVNAAAATFGVSCTASTFGAIVSQESTDYRCVCFTP